MHMQKLQFGDLADPCFVLPKVNVRQVHTKSKKPDSLRYLRKHEIPDYDKDLQTKRANIAKTFRSKIKLEPIFTQKTQLSRNIKSEPNLDREKPARKPIFTTLKKPFKITTKFKKKPIQEQNPESILLQTVELEPCEKPIVEIEEVLLPKIEDCESEESPPPSPIPPPVVKPRKTKRVYTTFTKEFNFVQENI